MNNPFQVLETVLQAKPQMLILMGPFVDANNKAVQEGGISNEKGEDLDLIDIFELQLLPMLRNATLQLRDADCEVVRREL